MRSRFLVVCLALVVLLSACAPSVVTAPAPSAASNAQAPSSSEISWSQAASNVGKRVTVVGPVMSVTYASSSKGKPTFLNIGRNYPDAGRFTVLIWGEHLSSFPQSPESMYKGKTVAVTGLIVMYQGVPEIEVTGPNQIQVR